MTIPASPNMQGMHLTVKRAICLLSMAGQADFPPCPPQTSTLIPFIPSHLSSPSPPCSNRIIAALGRIEGSADSLENAAGRQPYPFPRVPLDLLEHLAGDVDMANPDLWVQTRLQELLDGERAKNAQQGALNGISKALEGGTGAAAGGK